MSEYESILKGLNEAIDYERGKGKARKCKISIAPVPEYNAKEIKLTRQKLELTQRSFAAILGVSKKTVEAWEAGRNVPAGSAMRIIDLLTIDPEILIRDKLLVIG